MTPEPGSRIGPNTVLPAHREAVTLRTADGLALVAELAVPVDREPRATVVLVHPLPTAGGMMDSHLLRKAAFRLPALAGLAVLRFNTRGTASEAGCSEGAFDHGVGERFDVSAAVGFVHDRGLPDPWLVGWSFGTDLTLMHGAALPVRGAVLISPPLHRAGPGDLAAWGATGRPVVCLVPEHDDYLRPAEARARFAALPGARVVPFAGARHLLVGFADQVLDEVVRAVAPAVRVPLPRVCAG